MIKKLLKNYAVKVHSPIILIVFSKFITDYVIYKTILPQLFILETFESESNIREASNPDPPSQRSSEIKAKKKVSTLTRIIY